MFKKVLLSDDLLSISQGVFDTVKRLGITDIERVQYCDDAYMKIKKATMDNDPIELFITDLSFKKDHRDQTFESGEELVKVLKQEHPTLKIIVFSVENRLQRVRNLMEYKTDAYVCKGRHGLEELSAAISAVYNNSNYMSHEIELALNSQNEMELGDVDIEILQQLSLGMSQDDISIYLKNKGIKPNSTSSIEKRITKLRIDFKANNSVQLISIVKDLGIL